MKRDWHCSRRLRPGFLLFPALCAMLLCGCGKTEVEPRRELKEGEVAAPAFEIMLHQRTVESDGRALTLDQDHFKDVKVLDVSPRSQDGSYTSTISFLHTQDGGDLRVKLRVTYRVEQSKNRDGIVINTYPVSKVEALSIQPVDKKG